MTAIQKYEKLGFTNDFMFSKIMQDKKICKPLVLKLITSNTWNLRKQSISKWMQKASDLISIWMTERPYMTLETIIRKKAAKKVVKKKANATTSRSPSS